MAKKKKYQECISTPFKTGIRNFTSVAEYFMYYAPEIDSAQSAGGFSEEKSKKIFNKLMEKSGIKSNGIIQKQVRKGSWKKVDLEKDELDFEYSRFLCSKYTSETELRSILRHIRNALAHGHIYVWRKGKKGDFIFLLDMDNKKKISAKMMLSYKILEQWKAILENEIAIGE